MKEIEKFYQCMSQKECNYHIHISEQNSYIYFEVPKVACTTVKSTLQELEALTLGQNLPSKESSIVHNKKLSLLRSPSDIGIDNFLAMLNNNNVFKFCFVRNPYTRLLSVYLNKMSWREGQFYKKIAEILDMSVSERITFKQFVMAIKNQSPLAMDPHWRVQTYQTFYGLVDYNFIGRFENLNQDLKVVLNRIENFSDQKNKCAEAIEKLSFIRGGKKTNADSKLRDFYGTQEIRDLVFSIYKEDFHNFDYSEYLI
ncbi:MAG: sulfotransferase family protein [Okeania sp.]|nr:sulfotransferase family protein [Okeania sp.]